MDLSTFHVVTVISNPYRYDSRYDLYQTFEEDIKRKGGQLWTIELQTGKRYHSVTKRHDSHHIQIHNSSLPGDVWVKENLINLAVQRLTSECPDWRYVAWVDADIKFEDGFLTETANHLQHWDVVQMFSHAIDYGPDNETLQAHQSFMYCYWNGIEGKLGSSYMKEGHPGFAWAMRREAWNKLGGLIDWAVIGSADRYMACALIGHLHDALYGDYHPNYVRWLDEWEHRANTYIKKNVSYVPGTIRHLWHGRKKDRRYDTRAAILCKFQFNPERDLKRDAAGVWQFVCESERQIGMRDAFRKYYLSRKEDATTVD